MNETDCARSCEPLSLERRSLRNDIVKATHDLRSCPRDVAVRRTSKRKQMRYSSVPPLQQRLVNNRADGLEAQLWGAGLCMRPGHLRPYLDGEEVVPRSRPLDDRLQEFLDRVKVVVIQLARTALQNELPASKRCLEKPGFLGSRV